MVKGDPDKVIKITVNIDAEDSDELDDFTHMHIAVPPNNTDLLKDGYIGTVFSDIKKIVDPNDTLGTAHDEQAKQYLLANLFLSRCR